MAPEEIADLPEEDSALIFSIYSALQKYPELGDEKIREFLRNSSVAK